MFGLVEEVVAASRDLVSRAAQERKSQDNKSIEAM